MRSTCYPSNNINNVLKHLSGSDEKFTVCSIKYESFLIAREYKLKVVEKHFRGISKSSKAEVRQMKTIVTFVTLNCNILDVQKMNNAYDF